MKGSYGRTLAIRGYCHKMHVKGRFALTTTKAQAVPNYKSNDDTMEGFPQFRVLVCVSINIYILETRVTSLIWLKERVERPFIRRCSNWLLTGEPFTSTNGERLSAGAQLSSQAPERKLSQRGDIKKTS